MTTKQDELARAIETLNAVAGFLSDSARVQQDHPEEAHSYASEFDYNLAQAADEIRSAAALLQADGKAGGEVALWVSPGQFENLKADHDDESGTYLPVRHTSRGKFTMPLYTHPQPQAVAQGWKPIETAPKDGTVILVTDTFTYRSDPEKKPHHVYRAVHWNEGSYGWEIYNDGEIIDEDGPTYWMPLPAEPGAMLSASPGPAGRDWSLLEATQESLREHMAMVAKLREAADVALEALDKAHHAMQADMAQDQIEDAITKIKEARG